MKLKSVPRIHIHSDLLRDSQFTISEKKLSLSPEITDDFSSSNLAFIANQRAVESFGKTNGMFQNDDKKKATNVHTLGNIPQAGLVAFSAVSQVAFGFDYKNELMSI